MVNGACMAEAIWAEYRNRLTNRVPGGSDLGSFGCSSKIVSVPFDFPQPTINRRSHFSKSNSPARCVAFTTALISVTRNLPSSSSRMPSMVQPAGVVTASFNSAG
jgi:hypothetical protein